MTSRLRPKWAVCLGICLVFAAQVVIELTAGPAALAQTPPRVKKGGIDLRQWNFKEMGPVPLDGRWRFYWKQFVWTGVLPDTQPEAAPDYLKVPYVWNDHKVAGQRLRGPGYASYRLRIQLAPNPQPLAFYIRDAATACAVYANGRRVFQAGQPGISRSTSSPSFRPSVINLPADGGDIDLIVHVSNHNHRQGGLWERITLGTPTQLLKIRENRIAYNMIILGILLMAGIYHFGLYVLRRQDPSALYFGLGCLAISLRAISTGERYLVQLFPGFPFDLLSKLEYLGFYLAVGCFILFGQSLFPKETDRTTIKFLAGASLGFSILVVLTPLRFYSYTTPAFSIVTLLALFYGFVIMGQALAKKRPGARIFLVGFAILAATVVNDILYSRQFIQSIYMGQIGLIGFIMAQTFLLASRFSKSFETVQTQRSQLRLGEEKYRQLVDNAGDGIFILQDNAFQFTNPRTEAITGFKAAELTTLAFTSLVHSDDQIRVREHLEKGGRFTAGITTCSFRLDKRSGETVWVALNTVPTTWETKPATLNFLRDISDQKKLENQLNQAQKMEALGTLSGGIALNFNNILGSIVGNAELAAEKLPQEDPQRLYLDHVIGACMQAKQLVEQIMIFSRKGKYAQSPVNIGTVIEGAIQFLSASISPKIKIHSHVITGEMQVMANSTQISQLLSNLVTNSAQALQDRGGDLHISLHPLTIKEGQGSREANLAPGDYVRLTVADNGSGIPADIQPRIFDPYFTTKDADKGTGMGLSVVMGIVNNHGGHIDLVSTPGLGTTFHIYLPVLKKVKKTGPAVPDSRPPVGWERVLVVDDDERILRVLVEMLKRLGYEVIPFKDAETALEALHKDSRPYDLVITDLIMTGMSGIEFARRVKDLRSDLPIILSTGFMESPEAKHTNIIKATLKKPFHKEDLARVVRAALDNKVHTDV